MDTTDARWAWVALALVPSMGWNARRYHDVLAVGAPAELFRASRRALAEKVGDDLATSIKGFDAPGAIAGQRAAAERAEARLVILEDADYPPALKTAPLPPPFLIVRGTLAREDALSVAVVGSRRPTGYGLRTAERLAGDLAGRGVTVVSGFARGVDTAAHRGALDAGGRTLAVLGSGVDVVYPSENRPLVRAIAAAGAVISQFPMGTAPLPQHFPIRNRVIAGLALGTVVVEAAERSGALITARHAGELGREVYAVPGNVSSATSEGANRLIQDGAKLVRDWEDVVAEWPAVWRAALRPTSPAAATRVAAAGGTTGAEGRLLPLLGEEPVAIDDVIDKSGLPAGDVAASLMTLELRGLVRQLPGQRYVRR
ncbi:MAG TPA: DNA-processing protein DprA [Methylomirabilota bacterium]|jgi:DNA processing protein|nr:DNA-processing protein DprA [Methylomirabilota bacterium]HEV8699708.1 DNA-processing protein DprA [Candidatus Polarisedimenticolia bacterium]